MTKTNTVDRKVHTNKLFLWRHSISLVCVITAIGTAAWISNGIYTKYSSIRIIESAGGSIKTHYDVGPWLILCSAHTLERIDSYLGWPLFGRVNEVQLGLVDDQIISAVLQFPTICRISSFDDETATNKLFCRLTSLKHIDRLTIQIKGSTYDDKLIMLARNCPKLTCLYMSGSTCSDNGLEHCAQLPLLKELWICGGQISDVGINHLKRCSQLRLLLLGADVLVSNEIIKETVDAIPGLRIIRLSEGNEEKE